MVGAASGHVADALLIDGSYGEGGGQIVRTALAMSALTGRPIRIENLRAGRKRPGLAAQHLTAVHAAAAVCEADVKGATLGSQVLEFRPGTPPRPGAYAFDVGQAREGGSAGSAPLVLQTVLLPLALAPGNSTVHIEGGTHLIRSPSFDYLDQVWRPALAAMGIAMRLTLLRSGWYPLGRGLIAAEVQGGRPLRAFTATERGPIRSIVGKAITANLPDHVAARMARHAVRRFCESNLAADVGEERVEAACPGAALFLVLEHGSGRAGFTGLGRPGKPAEEVAEEAVGDLLCYLQTGAALDAHLGDQILLPAVLAEGASVFTVERVTRHLTTNAWIIERFGVAPIGICERLDGSPTVSVGGAPRAPAPAVSKPR